MQGNGDAKMTNLDAEGNGDAAATPPLLPDIGLGRQRAWGRLGWATAGGWSSGGIHWILRWGPVVLGCGSCGQGPRRQWDWEPAVRTRGRAKCWAPVAAPGGARRQIPAGGALLAAPGGRARLAAHTQVLFFPSCVSGGGKDL